MDRVEIFNERLRVSINPLGAEVNSIKSLNGTEFIWQADPSVWARHAPVLFPIVGALKDGQYCHQQRMYSMSQHGFARDSLFELVSHTEQTCTLSLRATEQSLERYPFNFELLIHYHLEESSLHVSYQVNNLDDHTMVFSIGGHPAFNLLLQPEDSIDQFSIQFSEKEATDVYLLKDGLIPEQSAFQLKDQDSLPLSKGRFDEDALIILKRKSDVVSLKHKTRGRIISMACKDFPHLGIWSKPGASFVCIEPWQGYADLQLHNGQLNDKAGTISLVAGEIFKAGYSIEVNALL